MLICIIQYISMREISKLTHTIAAIKKKASRVESKNSPGWYTSYRAVCAINIPLPCKTL